MLSKGSPWRLYLRQQCGKSQRAKKGKTGQALGLLHVKQSQCSWGKEKKKKPELYIKKEQETEAVFETGHHYGNSALYSVFAIL